MEYTKGEWRMAGDKALDCGSISIASINEHRVIPVAQIDKRWENAKANAHLIASAPDLYEAVRWVLEDHKDKRIKLNVSTHTKLLNALTKAEK